MIAENQLVIVFLGGFVAVILHYANDSERISPEINMVIDGLVIFL